MSDLYRAEVTTISPSRRDATLDVRQIHPDACALRLLAAGDPRKDLRRFMAHLLAEATHDNALRRLRAALNDLTRDDLQGRVTLVRHTSHSLIHLVDHDRAALRALIDRTGWADLDPEVYRESHDDEPVYRADPGYYTNFVDEAVFRVEVDDSQWLAHLDRGLTWKSAAY